MNFKASHLSIGRLTAVIDTYYDKDNAKALHKSKISKASEVESGDYQNLKKKL